MPQRRRMFFASSSLAADHVLAEHLDLARVGRLQADDRAHQHRLAGARAADDAEDLAAADGEVEVLVDDLLAEALRRPCTVMTGFAVLRRVIPSRSS